MSADHDRRAGHGDRRGVPWADRVHASGGQQWVAGFPGRVIHVAVEACTGWLFVYRALEARGAIAHLAEPVETSALRGRKRRAKTDRADARRLRQLLCEGRLPESWAPPEHVRQWRSRARLRNTLVAERTSWTQRIRATLYHHGVAGAPDELRTLAGRQFLAGLELPADARERVTIALEVIDLLDAQLAELERDLRALARAQTGCQALMSQYGMGELSALMTLCELGDVTRLHASRQAVRLAGIDIGVHLADQPGRDLNPIDLPQVRLHITDRQPAAVEGEDLLVEPLKAPLALAHNLRLKAPVTIARRLDPHRAVLGRQRLRCAAVASVPRTARRFLMRFVPEMVGQLDLHRPLHKPLRQPAQEPAGPDDLLLRTRSGQQLIDELVRQLGSHLIRLQLKDPRRGRRLA